MDVHEALYTTRAMRRLKPDPIPREAQARILDAAIRAPNIGQEWRFILVDDPAIIARLAPLYREAFEGQLRQYGMEPEELERLDGPMGTHRPLGHAPGSSFRRGSGGADRVRSHP